MCIGIKHAENLLSFDRGEPLGCASQVVEVRTDFSTNYVRQLVNPAQVEPCVYITTVSRERLRMSREGSKHTRNSSREHGCIDGLREHVKEATNLLRGQFRSGGRRCRPRKEG